ncbi:TolC family protein [Fodinibius halophilus]|uniref:TolC family protein n=1 Tax=Fodinibius halophilus TaxID=1736908 RepID=A0A6M1TGR3_9BACT|nr:TolC family protein [Fodinibius halophilus]NGP89292.1 TolC family protein [Fodinibius halophilus]
MKILTAIVLAVTFSVDSTPPDSISLQYCYDRVAETYPTAKKVELQRKITALNARIANTGYYPQVDVGAKATYQSEVTEFGLPGSANVPSVSKDQYEASINVMQNIFSGGAVGIRKELEHTKGMQNIHETEIEMHQIRSQLNQVYFGILLSKQQQEVNSLLIENLREQLSSVEAKVKSGVLLPSQQNILKAELIKAQQDSATVQSTIRASYRVLGELINEEVTPSTPLTLPEPTVSYQSLQPKRAEYELFETTRKALEQRKELAETEKLPKVSAFGTVAYGRPGYNFLNDDFHEYYMVGIQLQWSLLDFLNSDREMQALKIEQKKVRQNEKAFNRQLNARLDRIEERLSTIRENIKGDKRIIALRKEVVRESASKLKNGTITATEYVTELNQANKAQLSLFLNRVKLSEAHIEYATVLGVPLN